MSGLGAQLEPKLIVHFRKLVVWFRKGGGELPNRVRFGILGLGVWMPRKQRGKPLVVGVHYLYGGKRRRRERQSTDVAASARKCGWIDEVGTW